MKVWLKIQYIVDSWLDKNYNNLPNPAATYHKNGVIKEVHYNRFVSKKILVMDLEKRKILGLGVMCGVVYKFSIEGEIILRKKLYRLFKKQGTVVIGNPEVDYYCDKYRTHFYSDISTDLQNYTLAS